MTIERAETGEQLLQETHPSSHNPHLSHGLRNMFLKINPYHFSCPYKASFSSSAVQNLLDCEDEFDIYHSPQQRVEMTKSSHSPRYKLSEGMENSEERTEESMMPLMTMFLDKLKLELPKPEYKKMMISPWDTCQFNHCADVSPQYVQKMKPVASTQHHRMPMISHPLEKCTSERLDSEHHLITRTQYIKDLSSRSHSKSADSAYYTNVVKGKHDIKDKHIMLVPTDCSYLYTYSKDIKYNFIHNTNWSEHMENYRCQKSKKSLHKRPLRIPSARGGSEGHIQVPKVGVKCSDVRVGAYVAPFVKTCHYQFMVNSNNLRTNSPIRTPNMYRNRSPSQSSSPRTSPIGPRKARWFDKGCVKKTPTPITPNPPPSPTQLSTKTDNKNAMVVRSRPSIPSNARGLVCDTAVETPTHVVSGVKGKGFRDKASPVLRPSKVSQQGNQNTAAHKNTKIDQSNTKIKDLMSVVLRASGNIAPPLSTSGNGM